MSLSIQHQRSGDILIVACAGRVVEGAESTALRQHLEQLAPDATCIVLDLADVDYVDSSGLGLLVRLAMRLRMLRGDMKLCAVPQRIEQVLTLTKLKSVFETYPSQADAVAAFSRRASRATAHERIDVDVLCVHRSTDVLAFVRTLLKQAGYGVMATDNLVDALILFQGTPTRTVLIEGDLRGLTTTTSASRFNRLIERLPIVEMPANFPALDPGVAGQELLARIGTALAARGGSAALHRDERGARIARRDD